MALRSFDMQLVVIEDFADSHTVAVAVAVEDLFEHIEGSLVYKDDS